MILHINSNYIYTGLHQNLIEKLIDIGVDCCVYSPVVSAEKTVIVPGEYVCVSECFSSRDRYFFYSKQRKILGDLQKNIDVENCDFIHAHTLFTDGSAAWKLAEKYGKPYAVSVRNTDVNLFFKKLFYLRSRGVKILRGAQKVVFLSAPYRDFVIDTYVPQKNREEIRGKSVVIPNGIDDFWHENRFTQERPVPNRSCVKLVFAGRILKGKNIPLTQEAMKLLRSRGIDCRLTVVGRTEDEEEYARVKADPFTECLPNMPKEELINIYRANDIFVMPSHTETFGLVYAEAMSQGLPVLYTKNQGFDGQFPDGEVGYAVSDTDAEELAERIEHTLNNYTYLSANCMEKSSKFVWDEIARTYKKKIYDASAGI